MIYSGPFWQSRAKISRACALMKDVEDELEAYRANPPIESTIGQGQDGLFAESKIVNGPVMAAVAIGDVLHSLRSALDIMAVDLVKHKGGNPKGVYFPMAENEAALSGRIREKKFHRAGPEADALLRRYQPYRGGNAFLRALHDFNVSDKHSELVPTVQQMEMETVVQADGDNLNVTLSVKPESLKLVFPDNTAFSGEPVLESLEKLIQLVDGIVEAFAGLVAE